MDRKLSFDFSHVNLSADKPARKAKDNLKLFLDNFGINFEIPTYFVVDAGLWRKNPDYMFKFVKYVFPN